MAGEVSNVSYVKIYGGDTLEKIAKRHFTTVEKLMELNPKIEDKNVILKGDTLKIPVTIFENQEEEIQGVSQKMADRVELNNLLDSAKVENPVDTIQIKQEVKTVQPAEAPAAKQVETPAVTKENSGSEENNIGKILFGASLGILAAIGLFGTGKGVKFLMKKLTKNKAVIKEVMHEPKVNVAVQNPVSAMKPTPEAQAKIAAIEKQLAEPTDYKKVAESYISNKPSRRAHKAKQKEYDALAIEPQNTETVTTNKRSLKVRNRKKRYRNNNQPKNLKELMDKRNREAAQAQKQAATQNQEAVVKQKPVTEQKQETQTTRLASIIQAAADRRKHLESIGLGNAHASASTKMSWHKYAQEHGTKYVPPQNGVAEADRRAEEIIKSNAQKNKEIDVFSSTHPNLKVEYVYT